MGVSQCKQESMQDLTGGYLDKKEVVRGVERKEERKKNRKSCSSSF